MRGWRRVSKVYDFRLSRVTQYLKCKFRKWISVSNLVVKVGDHILSKVTQLKYLRSIVQNYGEINHHIQARWLKWRSISFVLCVTKIPLKLKEIILLDNCETVIRANMLDGKEPTREMLLQSLFITLYD